MTRIEMAASGYCECLNFVLCSHEDLTRKLLRDNDPLMTEIINPKTIDFQVARTTLIPGILKSLSSNRTTTLPIRIFEIGDVV